MDDLIIFLRKRIAEDRAEATAYDNNADLHWLSGPFDPEYVLADLDAKQHLVELCSTETSDTGGLPLALRILSTMAAAHDDHPDYNENWRPRETSDQATHALDDLFRRLGPPTDENKEN